MDTNALVTGVQNPNYFGFANKLIVTIDFSLAAWNTVATHEVFTVTAPVRHMVFYRVRTSLTSGGAAQISFGAEGATTAYSAAQAYTSLTANNIVRPGSTVGGYLQWGVAAQRFDGTGIASDTFNSNGLDLGYEITTAALTGGVIDAVCYWTPILDGGVIVAGTGAAL